MKLNEIYQSKYLSAADIKAQAPVQARINSATLIEHEDRNVPGGKKQQIAIDVGMGKLLGLNRTNARMIGQMYGDDTDFWIGQMVQLNVVMVEAFGESTDAIRISHPTFQQTPAPQPPMPQPGNAQQPVVTAGGAGDQPPPGAYVDPDTDHIPFAQ